MSAPLRPAPLTPRVLAGALDTAAVVLLCGASFVGPLLLRGVVLPMWGVLAVMVGYSVLPLAFLGRTFSMRLFGLELCRLDGHRVDLANVLFRELLGRGFFPAAFLFTLIAGAIARWLGVGASLAPPVVTGVMTLASMAAVAVALVGHLFVLGRDDGRSLADLLAGSRVVLAPARPPPTDAEELEELGAQRRRVVRNVLLAEVVLAASVLGLPYLVTARGGETTRERIARHKLEALEAKFQASPGSMALFRDLEREYWRLGRKDDAERVGRQHRAALTAMQGQREAELRARLAESGDRETASALLELLDRQGRLEDAEAVYRQWLGATPSPSARAGFGNWLATNGRTAAAVVELERALAEDPLVPYGQTMLGVSLERLERFVEAREHLELALLDDPDDEDAQEALARVEARIGRLPGAQKLALQRRLDGWRRMDGGSPE
jgi:tetratricopeptide (TPR) repeat protein/uncharacterized RDD family membrane protein YckC